jgi:hypothetical protein
MRNYISIVETLNREGSWYDPQWFRGSVIDDGNGEPLICHHFTYFDFQEFDRMWGATYFKRDPESIDRLGIWFTTNPNARYANPAYGEARRMDCILRITRAKYFDDLPDQDAFTQLLSMVKTLGGATATREHLKTQGYDGIILMDTRLDRYDQTVIIAFENDQIRVVKNELLS